MWYKAAWMGTLWDSKSLVKVFSKPFQHPNRSDTNWWGPIYRSNRSNYVYKCNIKDHIEYKKLHSLQNYNRRFFCFSIRSLYSASYNFIIVVHPHEVEKYVNRSINISSLQPPPHTHTHTHNRSITSASKIQLLWNLKLNRLDSNSANFHGF